MPCSALGWKALLCSAPQPPAGLRCRFLFLSVLLRPSTRPLPNVTLAGQAPLHSVRPTVYSTLIYVGLSLFCPSLPYLTAHNSTQLESAVRNIYIHLFVYAPAPTSTSTSASSSRATFYLYLYLYLCLYIGFCLYFCLYLYLYLYFPLPPTSTPGSTCTCAYTSPSAFYAAPLDWTPLRSSLPALPCPTLLYYTLPTPPYHTLPESTLLYSSLIHLLRYTLFVFLLRPTLGNSRPLCPDLICPAAVRSHMSRHYRVGSSPTRPTLFYSA